MAQTEKTKSSADMSSVTPESLMVLRQLCGELERSTSFPGGGHDGPTGGWLLVPIDIVPADND